LEALHELDEKDVHQLVSGVDVVDRPAYANLEEVIAGEL
jgi:hypothetical protein